MLCLFSRKSADLFFTNQDHQMFNAKNVQDAKNSLNFNNPLSILPQNHIYNTISHG